MDQVLAEAKVEISPSSKVWEPQRAYEKRLSTIQAKENRKSLILFICFLVFIATSAQAPKAKRAKKKGAAAAASGGEEESEAERTQDEAPPRPKSRRVTRANPDADTAEEGTGDEHAPVTPKARPRPRPKATSHRKTREATAEVDEVEPSEAGSPLDALTPSEGPVEAEDTQTPRSSLKRPRTDDDDDDDEVAPNGTAGSETEGIPDIQVRRKRIRH